MSEQNLPKNEEKIVRAKNLSNTVIGITMAVLFLIGFALGHFFSFITKNDMEKKLDELFEIVQDKGIEAVIDEIGSDQFAEMLVELILEEDKYAEYFTEEEYKSKKAQGIGSYSGLGVSLSGTNVVRVIVNSPAFYAGFRVGDVLKSGKTGLNTATEFTSSEVLDEFLLGVELDTDIEFEVLRGNDTIKITVKKSSYIASYVTIITSQKAFHVISDEDGNITEYEIEDTIAGIQEDTLYLKLSSFEAEACVLQFAYAMEYAKEEGLTKIALDLRGNGGGRMDVMLNIATYLIYNDANKSSIITYVKEKNRTSHQATVENNFNTDITGITVIADGGSASASECLLGAMICYSETSNNTFSHANVVIENTNTKGTTYGKGIMQTTYELRTGGALKLTTGQLYWPDNLTTIHETGITVDENCPQNLVEKNMGITRAIEILNAISVQPIE